MSLPGKFRINYFVEFCQIRKKNEVINFLFCHFSRMTIFVKIDFFIIF